MSEVRRDWVGLEIPAVFAILVGGAVLRYWLSTVVPFDASELALLFEASMRDRGGRVPFIMFNGVALLMFYLVVRRSAGVAVAFALLLGLQTSISFQGMALRIRWSSAGILLFMLALAYWRHTRPARRAPSVVAVASSILAVLLGARGIYLGVTLPARLDVIRRETTGDVEALYASLVACGGGDVTRLETLRDCELSWPTQRSLDQQEALLRHAQALSSRASVFDGSGPVPQREHSHVGIFDRSAGAFFVVAEGEMEAIAKEIVGRRR